MARFQVRRPVHTYSMYSRNHYTRPTVNHDHDDKQPDRKDPSLEAIQRARKSHQDLKALAKSMWSLKEDDNRIKLAELMSDLSNDIDRATMASTIDDSEGAIIWLCLFERVDEHLSWLKDRIATMRAIQEFEDGQALQAPEAEQARIDLEIDDIVQQVEETLCL